MSPDASCASPVSMATSLVVVELPAVVANEIAALSTVVADERRDKMDVADDALAPTASTMEPLLPSVESPVVNDTSPELPSELEPVSIVTAPDDWPAAEVMDIAPLSPVATLPDSITMCCR